MKLMVVDDETATRNGILKYVHWTELGIEQIKAAGSALEALRIALSGNRILSFPISVCRIWTV